MHNSFVKEENQSVGGKEGERHVPASVTADIKLGTLLCTESMYTIVMYKCVYSITDQSGGKINEEIRRSLAKSL